MAAWYEDLRHFEHICGQPLLVGERHNGYQLSPVFQTEPGYPVTYCPRCHWRLNLNDCRQVPALASGPAPVKEPLMR